MFAKPPQSLPASLTGSTGLQAQGASALLLGIIILLGLLLVLVGEAGLAGVATT